eukprot:scaffold69174_cov28-Tisochrysis_lutea.AAC.2
MAEVPAVSRRSITTRPAGYHAPSHPKGAIHEANGPGTGSAGDKRSCKRTHVRAASDSSPPLEESCLLRTVAAA